MKRTNLVPRIILAALILAPAFFISDFYQHFYVYLTGSVITRIITEQWHIVVLNILVFSAFLIPLSFRRKANWAEYGLVTAFFVSLFIEMYGIPLTILFASKYFYNLGEGAPPHVVEFDLLGVGFGMDAAMAYGAVLMILGTVLIVIGWITLYLNVKKGRFVSTGIYAYSRHPQYLGFILVILGWFFGWPTLISLIFVPLLVYKYIRVCLTEEKEIEAANEYQAYRKTVPFFV
jgi:hypothetical protein